MLKPNVNVKEFEKYGFRKCKGHAGRCNCYYLCISRGAKMLFVSPDFFDVMDWKDNDSRIHVHPNCKYHDYRTYLDVLYELIKDNMIICI